MMTGGVRIIYSRLGETADFVIKKILEKAKKEWVVVSSDRDIAAYVWSHGGVAVPTSEFHEVLRKAATSFSGDYEPLEEYDGMTERRGNPRRPSKKEKALLRTLKKL
jgi:predicted RNA-binding protein with PIN domain